MGENVKGKYVRFDGIACIKSSDSEDNGSWSQRFELELLNGMTTLTEYRTLIKTDNWKVRGEPLKGTYKEAGNKILFVWEEEYYNDIMDKAIMKGNKLILDDKEYTKT